MRIYARLTVTQDVESEVSVGVLTRGINRFFREHEVDHAPLTEDEVIKFWKNKNNISEVSEEKITYKYGEYSYTRDLCGFVCDWIEEILFDSENYCVNDEWVTIDEAEVEDDD